MVLKIQELDTNGHMVMELIRYWYDKQMSLEFMADSVIQATGTVEFEDGLRMLVHLGG